MATAKLYEFTRRLKEYCGERQVMVFPWVGFHKNTANLLRIEGSGLKKILYVKDSGLAEGFWGVNENQLEQLERSGSGWSLVLLLGPGLTETGYLITSAQVHNCIENGLWSSNKTDWVVHEKEISGNFKFASFNQLFSTLVS